MWRCSLIVAAAVPLCRVPTALLSGASVSCADGHRRTVYRFTPRCTRTIECTWWQSSAFDSHYPPKNGSSAIGWRVGSGWSVNPVCGDGEGDEWLATCGKVWLAEHPVSTAGAWIVLEN